MLQVILTSLILAISMCADCFAVCAASSVTLGRKRFGDIFPMALSFGFVQAGLFLGGYLFGNLFVGFIEKAAHLLGFALLLYVGGSMLWESIRGIVRKESGEEEKHLNLTGFKNIVLGAVATSMDALAVGVSLSMDARPILNVVSDTVAIFAVTMLSVYLGVLGGSKAGEKYGRTAEIVGGTVLIAIGVAILLGVI